jgi:hypothetical protein
MWKFEQDVSIDGYLGDISQGPYGSSMLNVTATSTRSQMPYKKMNICHYIGLTLILTALQIFLSIICGDISIIFEFLSAIAYSSISFIMPGWFFLNAWEKYGNKNFMAHPPILFSRFLVVLGVLLFVVQITLIIYGLVNPE